MGHYPMSLTKDAKVSWYSDTCSSK